MTDFKTFMEAGTNFKETLEIEVTHPDGSVTKHGIVSERHWKKNSETGELEPDDAILSEGSGE